MSEVKKLMDIPKQHTLRHYVSLVGKLYGESQDFLANYADEVVVSNEKDLDKAIRCFQGMVPAKVVEDLDKKEREKRQNDRFSVDRPNTGSRLRPMPHVGRQILTE